MFKLLTSTSLIAAVALFAPLAPAHAQQVSDGVTQNRMVQISDLDLHSDTGVAALRLRIELAAEAVCKGPSPAADLSDPSYGSCVATAMAQAKTQTDELVASVRGANLIALADSGH